MSDHMEGLSRASVALSVLDVHGIHRDIVGYYRQFGFMNSSTSSDLADVITRNCVLPPAYGHSSADPLPLASSSTIAAPSKTAPPQMVQMTQNTM